MEDPSVKTLDILARIDVLPQELIDGILKIIPDATLIEILLWKEGKLPRGRRLPVETLEYWGRWLEQFMDIADAEERGSAIDDAKIDAALRAANKLPRDTHARTPYLTAEAACDKAESYEGAAVMLHANRLQRAFQRAEVQRRKRMRDELADLSPDTRRLALTIIDGINQALISPNLKVTPAGFDMVDRELRETPDYIPEYAQFAQSKRVQGIE